MRSPLVAAAAAVLVASVSAGCGGSDRPALRIGVLLPCLPPLDGFADTTLAAAQAPLLRAGARPAGDRPADGLKGAAVAGRRVAIVTGCSPLNAYSRTIEETRRLVEREHADVVIGPTGNTDGAVFRSVARRYPGTTFVAGWSAPADESLRPHAPNFFQFGPTGVQAVAGLATYAYRKLGWRTAAIAADDYPWGWDAAAGFSAEFCALGGRMVSRDYSSLFSPTPAAEDVARARSADGVAILSLVGAVAPLAVGPYVAAVERGRAGLAHRVVLGGPTFLDPRFLQWTRDPSGVVVAESEPFSPTPTGAALAALIRRTYPDLPSGPIATWGIGYVDEAVQAVVGALGAVHGDLSDDQRRFRSALASREVASARGPVRLDARRHTVVNSYLGRVSGREAAARIRPFARIEGVDETLRGTLTSTPERAPAACVRRAPPPWGRTALTTRASR